MVRFVVMALSVALCAIGAAQVLGRLATPTPSAAVATVAPAPALPPAGGGDASIAKSADGHFWADAEVDGHPVRFLIDTGATAVALTAADARNLGIDPDSLNYSYQVMTAAGPARAAAVRLDMVSVGRAQVVGVDAFVIDKGLQTSLLGMSFLGRLSTFEATPDALVLRS